MKITEIETTQLDGTKVAHIIIDNEDGSFTSMTKAIWDQLEAQREQSGTL